MLKRAPMMVVACVLAGCAIAKPMIDPASVSSQEKYRVDLSQCADVGVLLVDPDGGWARGFRSDIDLGAGPVSAASLATVLGRTMSNSRIDEKIVQAFTARCLENRGYRVENAEEVGLSPNRWCIWKAKAGLLIDEPGKNPLRDCIRAEEIRWAERERKRAE